MRTNYCTNCGFLSENGKLADKCPVCGSDKKYFSSYDTKLEQVVKRSVQGNLSYPDMPGTDWAHPNSSLSRHMRAAVFNATIASLRNGRK